MSNTWILVADNRQARLFSAATARGGLKQIRAFSDDALPKRSRDAKSDRPGRVNARVGDRRSSMEPRSDPKEVAVQQFAARIAAELVKGYNDHEYEKLGIAAGPTLLGLIRKQLTAGVARSVAFEVNRDLARLEPEEIRKHLPEKF